MFNKIKKLVYGVTLVSTLLAVNMEVAEAAELTQYEKTYSTPVGDNISELVEGKLLVTPIRNNRYVPYNYLTDFEKIDFEVLKEVVKKHYEDLEEMGVNVNNISEVSVFFDITKKDTHGGGMYIDLDTKMTWNPFNFVSNTIVVNKALYADTDFRHNKLNETFVHEFGHHLGYSVLHRNKNYTDFHSVRNGNNFITSENYMYYSHTWRNLEYEQVAETYTELFFDNYFNKTATPNLTLEERENFTSFLQQKIN